MKKLLTYSLFVVILFVAVGCKKSSQALDSWVNELSGKPFALDEKGVSGWLGQDLASSSNKFVLKWMEGQFESAETNKASSINDKGEWSFYGRKAVVDSDHMIRREAVIVFKNSDKKETFKSLAAVRFGENDWRPASISEKDANKLVAVVKMLR
ncbi:MAG: hypothetical protein BA863_05845 [Desulfovibrio sp. S3730MH75]|nr:MAG: hypothetical protein BA863_05845 [Desulfovibrio sp. S3730MH75]